MQSALIFNLAVEYDLDICFRSVSQQQLHGRFLAPSHGTCDRCLTKSILFLDGRTFLEQQ